MWIPYDLAGSFKAETPTSTIERSRADRSMRDVLVGFFVRNPITQSWEIDIRADAVKDVLTVDLEGMPTEIACYGDESGKLSEIIYRVKSAEPYAAFDACRHDLEDRLARWTLELGRGMAIAGWRVADPANEARWRCTPFRPSALNLDLNAVAFAPDDLKPLLRLYQRARNASDPAWRLLNAYAVLKCWRTSEAPFPAQPQRPTLTVTLEMLVHSGALGCAASFKDQPLAHLVDALEVWRDAVLQDLETPGEGVHGLRGEARWRLAHMANLADLAAREALVCEIARRRRADLALAS
ncbi:methylamine utilization protein MauJ [Methylorubrum extorquens]|uniref:Methylamine utilization protein MauJ n=1 Tax=Methylorubrum extorquens (strain CM4 / NCIMB 13688) TaxID=440085 RepID=B7L1U2_METC4|nr:methylamine utilization protein MauJ [Methylorubrum extorquens]ACK81486.1 conserved hypothetical protein [Methylorubrum extorquens CM4]